MPEGPEGPYNPRAALAQLVQGQRERRGRKLSFTDQCAAFCALYDGVDSIVVARAFGISQTAASQIGGCLQTDPRPYTIGAGHDENGHVIEKVLRHRDMNRHRMPDRIQRYQRVAEAFNTMGEEAFFAKYFPSEMITKMYDAKHAIEGERSKRIRAGANLEADEGPDFVTLPDGQIIYVIKYSGDEERAEGWYIKGPIPLGREILEGGDPLPFKNKRAARAAIWRFNQYDVPRNP
jgi:hypothetical protein